MSLQQIPGLYFATSNLHGRGVFCINNVHAGDVIEIAPVVVLPKSQLELIDKTKLYEYYFLWGEKTDEPALVLGYGSVYNHSDNPNADFILDLESNNVQYVALTGIEAGTEITINYRAGRPDQSLWFEVRS